MRLTTKTTPVIRFPRGLFAYLPIDRRTMIYRENVAFHFSSVWPDIAIIYSDASKRFTTAYGRYLQQSTIIFYVFVLCVELIASVGVASAIAVCSHLFSALFRFVLPLQSQHQLDMLTAIAHRCGSAVSCIVPKDFLWASIHQEQKSTEFFPSPFYYLWALDVFMRNSRSARNRFSAAVVLCARRRLVF